MISSTSRYADSKIVPVDKADVKVLVITPSAARSFTFNYVFHIMKGQERLDNIAYAFYGDAQKWWKIADANPEILDWSNIPSGKIIRVPNA